MGYSRFSRKHIHGEEPTVATAGINFYDTGEGNDVGGGGYSGGGNDFSGSDRDSRDYRGGRDGTGMGFGNPYTTPGYGNNRPQGPGQRHRDDGGGYIPPGAMQGGVSGNSGTTETTETVDPELAWQQAQREAAMRKYYGQVNNSGGVVDQMINNRYGDQTDIYGNVTPGYASQMGNIGDQYGDIIGGTSGKGTPTGLQALIAQQQGINSGTADPRFAAYQTAQNDLLNTQRQNANTQSSDFFARRGLGGSSAMRNEQMRIGSGYDQQQAALSGNIGLQQLQRQDQAGANIANLYGQQAGLLGQQAGVVQGAAGLYGTGLGYAGAGVESLLGPETLEISRLAADRAGG